MKVSDYIARFLVSQGVTDAFGIPGGVILDFIYALDAADGITPHLSYHEQTAGFAACGYAQAAGRLGVAYATRGPGFTNLLSPMADAYYDSIPVLFVTGHTTSTLPTGSRIIEDQEMDTCGMVRNITKYAKRVDSIEDVQTSFEEACRLAMEGRKGPVFLDIKASLYQEEIELVPSIDTIISNKIEMGLWQEITDSIRNAKRPVVLVGDGINQCALLNEFNEFIRKANIPVLSSRYSHNVVSDAHKYFGYVGSHGIRYANFILSKADLIITLGNRLSFPSGSISYTPIVNNAKILRFDVDNGEFLKHTDISNKYLVDLKDLLPALAECETDYGNHKEWLSVCETLRQELWNEDRCEVVNQIANILSSACDDAIIISDVGNNEFWVSRACVLARCVKHTLYSKSFGALGNALGKAIGAYYATGKHPIVFIGDQGFQLNMQELQYISQHQLPINIVLLDNNSSGMIKDRQALTRRSHYLHTTADSGYGNPDFKHIVCAYKINLFEYEELSQQMIKEIFVHSQHPSLIHVKVDENTILTPSLPKGQPIQDMSPLIDRTIYDKLSAM